MKRDPYLIRELLLGEEDGTEVAHNEAQDHVDLLINGGYLEPVTRALTWKGADLLDLCRDGDRFKAAVNQVKAETGGVNFELLTALLSNP